jgi:hypothetical protein
MRRTIINATVRITTTLTLQPNIAAAHTTRP